MDLRKKYYKYIQEFVKKHNTFLFMTYEQWLEDLTKKLSNENSLLCPIGDLDTIQSLLVEKRYMAEEIKRLTDGLKYIVEIYEHPRTTENYGFYEMGDKAKELLKGLAD